MRRLRRWLRRTPPEPLDRTGPATLYVLRDGNPGRHLLWQDLVGTPPTPSTTAPVDEPTADRSLRVPCWVDPDRWSHDF